MEKSNLVMANIFSIWQWEDSSYPLQLRRARYLVLSAKHQVILDSLEVDMKKSLTHGCILFT